MEILGLQFVYTGYGPAMVSLEAGKKQLYKSKTFS